MNTLKTKSKVLECGGEMSIFRQRIFSPSMDFCFHKHKYIHTFKNFTKLSRINDNKGSFTGAADYNSRGGRINLNIDSINTKVVVSVSDQMRSMFLVTFLFYSFSKLLKFTHGVYVSAAALPEKWCASSTPLSPCSDSLCPSPTLLEQTVKWSLAWWQRGKGAQFSAISQQHPKKLLLVMCAGKWYPTVAIQLICNI